MLQSLHIKNIALIDEVEIDFTDGLNILTGETGAGKSIIIDSVNFALGAKVPKGIVRDDAQYALAELVFDVSDEDSLAKIRNMGISVENSQVILQRKIVNGKSSCKVNGENVPASLLREIAGALIDIHGQHEHQSLLYKKNHKLMLDGFCGDDFIQKLSEVGEVYDAYYQNEEEYRQAVANMNTRLKDLDYSKYVVSEIEAANLCVGEDTELEEKFSRMNNSKRILESVTAVASALGDDEGGAASALSYAISMFKPISSFDDTSKELMEQLVTIEDLSSDFLRQLDNYRESLEFSEEDFVTASERLDEINRLKMKYGQSIEEILAVMESESEKVDRLQNFEAYIEELKVEKDRLYDILTDVCAQVSDIRKKEAEILSKDIVGALNNLNFRDAQFEIKITSSADMISRNGWDDVEFMISLNPGEKVKPLTNVASGGELSRIMLALKSILAKRDSIDTLIFDEIDTGISGKTAQLVAGRMSDIASGHQVICVTHLPQIASHADTHFLIEKSVEDNHTFTRVTPLSYDGSVNELARMLAGDEITETVLKNATQLKEECHR